MIGLLRGTGGYLVGDLHVLDANGDIISWSLSIFLLDRLSITKYVCVRDSLVECTIGCLLNLGAVASILKMPSLGLRATKGLIMLRVISKSI